MLIERIKYLKNIKTNKKTKTLRKKLLIAAKFSALKSKRPVFGPITF